MLKVFEYNGNNVTFDFEGETFVNATEMAKPFGKRPIDFLKLKSTQEYIQVLESEVKSLHFTNTEVRNPHIGLNDSNGVVISRKGGDMNSFDQGTWMHELLALEFAGWLSPAFKVWCNQKIKELLTTGQASLSMEDMMIKQLENMKEQKLRLERVESEVKHIRHATKARPDYFTVAGYASYQGLSINLKMASSIGRKASQLCRTRGIPTDSIADPRFGTVGMYPSNVLEQLFREPINL
jgi:hypothetical protein